MSSKTIVITRPKGDGETLAEALQTRGHHVIHEPLTEIFLHHTARQSLHNALLAEPDAVIVTSRHGAQALALLSDLRDIYLLCVGEATAQAAQSLGFTRVATAKGNATSLIETVAQGYDAGSRFLYPSAKHVRIDIAEELAARGMEIERIVLYEAIPAPHLSDTLVEQLRRKQIDAVTFLSQTPAQLFMSLLAKADAAELTAGLQAFCISDAAAEPLAEAKWKGVHIANEATLASVVTEVDNVFAS